MDLNGEEAERGRIIYPVSVFAADLFRTFVARGNL